MSDNNDSLVLVLDMDGTLVAADANDVPHARPYLDEFLAHAFEHCSLVGVWTAASSRWTRVVFECVLEPALVRVRARLERPCAFAFVWTRNRCTPVPRAYSYGNASTTRVHKRLELLWEANADAPPERSSTTNAEMRSARELERLPWATSGASLAYATRDNTLIVDDTPDVYTCTPANGVPIVEYTIERAVCEHEPPDDALRRLCTLLTHLCDVYRATGTILDVEKFNWANE